MTAVKRQPMSPAEYGRMLAQDAPPLTREQIRAAARILATVPAKNAGDPQAVASHDDAA